MVVLLPPWVGISAYSPRAGISYPVCMCTKWFCGIDGSRSANHTGKWAEPVFAQHRGQGGHG